MAVTRIKPIHSGRDNNALKNIVASTDYIMNLGKTNNGELISSFDCDPKTIASEFLLSRREYLQNSNRNPKNDIVAYHFIQSFKAGEISAGEANKIGYETASRFLKGNHSFIVTTHIDKSHIHNHIIWNSISLDCKKKFRNFYNSYFHIRRLSDLICIENKLSVIANPAKRTPKKYTVDDYPKKISNREIIRADIDAILKDSPKSFDDFLSALSNFGYEIKQGKTISVKKNGQKRFTRLSTLGENYTKEVIKLTIKGARFKSKKKRRVQEEKSNLMINIEQKIAGGKGIGYQRFAESFNIKQLSKSVLFIQEKGFNTIEEYSDYVKSIKSQIDELQSKIDGCNSKMDDISELKKHIIAYAKYRKVFAEYKKLKYSKSFFEEHKEEIRSYKAAKKYFDSQQFENNKLPSVASLNEEFEKQKRQKNLCFDEIIKLRNEYREMLIHLKNIESILKTSEEKEPIPKAKKKNEQEI